MTNKDITAEELIEVLKFTPRTYKISMWGYGGEKVMGTVPKESWDYCMANSVDLSEIAWSDEDTVRDDMGLDPDKLPFPPGSWYECDSMAHVSGVSRNAGTLQIEDENGDTVVEQPLDDFDGDSDDSPEWSCNDEVWIGQEPAGTVVFVGNSNEKGTFFEGEIELTAPFDIRKLTLGYDEVDGEEIVNSVVYDGVEVDNWGGNTDGKSSDFTMCLVGEDGEWTRYEPEERDWGHPKSGPGPSDWERSPKFDFKKYKPVYPGWYGAVWSSWGTSYGSLYWDGENFGEWEYGKFNPVTKVETWSGFNWDTSDWANRPPAPKDIKCDNKKCQWVGHSEDRETDDDYNDHCPDCGGTEFTWINFDPDTKEGRANRELYCITQAEEKQFIAGLDAALAELAEESGIEFDNGDK